MVNDFERYDEVSEFVGRKIDKDSLDDELVIHSEMFSVIRENLYLLRSAMMDAKSYVDICYAELSGEIRRSKAEQAIKITEAALDSATKSRAEYRQAVSAYTKAAEVFDKWDLLKQNLAAKEFAIRQLVKLYQASYWVAGNENIKV